MFLGVSGNLLCMDPTDAERKRIAHLVVQARLSQFVYSKAAYTEAKVNSGPWSRIEKGLSVKPFSLAKAVRLLWPETGGDWQKIPGLYEDEPTPGVDAVS